MTNDRGRPGRDERQAVQLSKLLVEGKMNAATDLARSILAKAPKK
jgi:hypothetical protein